jgi:thymidylate synthase ThyX
MGLSQLKVELCGSWGGDQNAALAAWASSYEKELAEAKTEADIRRVVTGIVNLQHDTPKERCWIELFITCPIFVERHYDKYRMTVQFQDFVIDYLLAPFGRDGITQNELSGRYRTIPDRPYILPPDIFEIIRKAEGSSWAMTVAQQYNDMLAQAHAWYERQLQILKKSEKKAKISNAEYKRVRDVLRGVLGTSFLTDMRIVLNMNAFEHIVNQRLSREAQMESRVVAYQMIKVVQASGHLKVMIEEMIFKNNWAPLMDEVEAALRADQ